MSLISAFWHLFLDGYLDGNLECWRGYTIYNALFVRGYGSLYDGAVYRGHVVEGTIHESQIYRRVFMKKLGLFIENPSIANREKNMQTSRENRRL